MGWKQTEKQPWAKLFFRYLADMPALTDALDSLNDGWAKNFLIFIDAVLRGSGQVVFTNSPLSGIIILGGLFLNNWLTALCGLLAVISATLLAYVLKVKESTIRAGLCGYSPLLCGSAVRFFVLVNPSIISSPEWRDATMCLWAFIMGGIGLIFHLAIARFLSFYSSPAFTLGFNVSSFFFLALCRESSLLLLNPTILSPAVPSLSAGASALTTLSAKDFFLGSTRGVGQVFFADNEYSAVIILIGMALCSPYSALFAFLGSLLGSAIGMLFSASASSVLFGLWGYNSCLAAIAVGAMLYYPSLGSFLLASFASCLCGMVHGGWRVIMEPFGLPNLTFPFCFTAVVFVLISESVFAVQSIDTSKMSSPEHHMLQPDVFVRRRPEYASSNSPTSTSSTPPPELSSGSSLMPRKDVEMSNVDEF